MKLVDEKHFEKLNIRVGKIKAVENHPKIDEYILLIDLGRAEKDDMQIVADLKESYEMDELVGKQVVFVENFKPEEIEGVESQGLLLVTQKNKKPVLISPEKEVLTGVRVFGMNDGENYYHWKEGEHGEED